MKCRKSGKWTGIAVLLWLAAGLGAAGAEQVMPLPNPAEEETGREQAEEETQSDEKEAEEEKNENWLDRVDVWMEDEQNHENWWEDDWLYDDQEWAEEDEENREAKIQEGEPADVQKYLPVMFRRGISSLECFPETNGGEKVVQNGVSMLRLASVKAEKDQPMGAYYRKTAVLGEKWYDLKMTLVKTEGIEVLSKEGVKTALPEIGFCTDRIGWGLRGRPGKLTLKMEFMENGTEEPAAIDTRFCWRNVRADACPQVTLEDGSFGAHYFTEGENGLGDMIFFLDGCSTWYMTWENRENAPFEVIFQEDLFENKTDTEPHMEEREREDKKIVRKDAAVRVLVSRKDARTGQWIKDSVFEVYEWDGYRYSIYRGSLPYYEKSRHYIMDNLVRNEVNQGKYKIVETNLSGSGASGWQQEILVPEIPVVTDLYYYVEA